MQDSTQRLAFLGDLHSLMEKDPGKIPAAGLPFLGAKRPYRIKDIFSLPRREAPMQE